MTSIQCKTTTPIVTAVAVLFHDNNSNGVGGGGGGGGGNIFAWFYPSQIFNISSMLVSF